MTDGLRVLLIEDEPPIRRFLRVALAEGDFKLLEAENGKQGLRLVATGNPRLVLLDLGLPDMDGIDVITELRQWSQVPIIVLSVREAELQKVAALDAGANDYLTKPFGVAELVARMHVALRVSQPLPSRPVFEAGGLRVNFCTREIYKDGAQVHLTPLEFNLLAYMVRHAGLVLTHRQILTEVWGAAYTDQTQYLRVFMRNLRHKLEDDPALPALFLTETGVGYRLKA